jgi:hypothetical protein
MKKSILPLLMILFLAGTLAAQQTKTDQEVSNPPKKHTQAEFQNDIYLGYGALGIYYFTGRMKHSDDFPTEISHYNDENITTKFSDPLSAGTFYLGYQRSLNRVIGVGMMFGYQLFHYTGTATGAESHNIYPIDCYDHLITGSARLTFSYLSKPAVRMYSGIALGLTIDYGVGTINGETSTERKLWPGGQLTLMGLRFGRAFGGFIEFGFGSYGIINAGLSYKFKD